MGQKYECLYMGHSVVNVTNLNLYKKVQTPGFDGFILHYFRSMGKYFPRYVLDIHIFTTPQIYSLYLSTR